MLKLDPIIQTGIRDGFVSMGHGRAIINIDETNKQLEIYEKILSKKLSVRQTEDLVRNYQQNKVITVGEKDIYPEYIKKGTETLSEYFGHKISVKVSKNGSGKITIPFNSEDDFNRIKKLAQSAK